MSPVPVSVLLRTSRLILRPWRLGDEGALVRYVNNRKIWLNVRDSLPFPYTIEDAMQWVHLSATLTHQVSFAMEWQHEAVGAIGLILQEDVYRSSAEIGYWLGEPFWGQGLMTEAVDRVTEWALYEFGLRRLWTGVFEHNKASMRVLEKCGYALEGISKKAVMKDGEIWDEYRYAIVKP